ncbi:MAG: non-lysosomal glucosylceramidase [Methylacidiphilales bacterium]|nr:non-lysosomal glucosylceramidase [Candidatus Methylacidiphilales bacterium]
MKTFSLLLFLAFSMVQFALRAQAGDPFNPSPAKIETPGDNTDAVLKRLTTNSDGKTPVVKYLDPAWIKSLADRGESTLYTKANSHDFDYIGMPIGGIGAGEIYLSGDGRLWDWDIFGTRCNPGFPVDFAGPYQFPHKVGDPQDVSQDVLDQGFIIRTQQGDKKDIRTLDKNGFSDITFSGQYPIGSVDYSDPASPVRVHLEAFSPFIPSNVDDSSYPATILNYTVENTSTNKVECTLGGWMENAAGIAVRNEGPILLENVSSKNPGYTTLNFGMKPVANEGHPPTIFDDFESGTYKHWTAQGDAFGAKPAKLGDIRHSFPILGSQGQYMVDSLYKSSDKATGTLTSESFVINRPYLLFLVGGGKDPHRECVNLLVDAKVVRTATGQNDEVLRLASWDVKDLIGKTAQLQIVDRSSQPWGHILADDFAFSDAPDDLITIKDQSDVGDMALAMMGDDAEAVSQVSGDKSSDACLDASVAGSAELKVFGDKSKLVGALRRTRTLAPGEKMIVSFIVSWYFPNPLNLGLSTPMNRQYGVRFKSAQDVVDHLAANFDRFTAATREWRDTWYDSTLPYYFLDRTFLNTSTLATSTSYLLGDGRFYAFEGRYSCPGTCTHVWSYQQAMGYLFPDLEKAIMEKVEFVPGLGMNEKGGITIRAEYGTTPVVDGQSGIILRTYLAHRMSADNAFLQRNYSSVKKAIDFLINRNDPKREGILEGPQDNTMDAAWYGKITWLSLYYQAALRAAAEMADVSNDGDYARSLRAIADKGRNYVETQLFNGEYFIQQPDPAHPESLGTFNGCPLEQVMGQNWAYQVGLGDIVDHEKVLTALNSIWKYNYTTDVGPYRNVFKPGRWLAMPGEGGLIMCTLPYGGKAPTWGNPSFYNNECWAGSEYEETALMMWDGLVDKALAEIKTLQARYDGAKRNPWDECEAGGHYSRSMADYGVFIAACGFEYDGPKGTMTFAPRVNPENFKAAFTSAEGWGGFSQKYVGQELDAKVVLRYGKLRLKKLSLILPPGNLGKMTDAQVEGKDVPISATVVGDRISLDFSSELLLETGQSLVITIK